MEKFGLIGAKLPHSVSPQIHALLGIKNYALIELEESELPEFFKKREYEGFNITIPYKEKILSLLKEVRGAAKEIGAVNTAVLEEGGYVGYNTDADGMEFALSKAGIEIKDKRALILGTGGTSKTAEYVLRKNGAKSITKVGRTSEINYDNVYELTDAQIIINTTPVGMFPNVNACPVDVKRFEKLTGVFDCVYNPKKTLLVKSADSLGIPSSNGLYMLIEQARKAEELFLRKSLSPLLTDYVIKNLRF